MDPKPEILRRLKLKMECESSKEFLLDELSKCSKDPIYFIDNWIWTYDPRKRSKLPFKLFPAQKRYVLWLYERYITGTSGVVVKPRDIGATWVCASFSIWGFLFKKDISIGFSSRKLKYVDEKGNPDSIFGKIRVAMDMLPTFLKPNYHDKNGLILNLENGATLKGEGGDNVGRGGRSKMYFLDEFAFCDHQDEIDHAVTGNIQGGGCAIYLSTFTTPGNLFYKLATEGKMNRFDFKWTDDLRKDQNWYDKTKAEKDSLYMAREVDCDPYASTEGSLLKKEWIQASVALWKRLIKSDDLASSFAGYDPAGSGTCESVVVIRNDFAVLSITAWKNDDSQISSEKAFGLAQSCSQIYYDADGGWGEVFSNYLRQRKHTKAFGIRGGATSNSERFLNRRARLYWNLKERFEATYKIGPKPSIKDLDKCIAIPDDGKLIDQLLSIVMEERDDGKIKVRSKLDMQKKGLASPDRADALAYAFAEDIFKSGAIHV